MERTGRRDEDILVPSSDQPPRDRYHPDVDPLSRQRSGRDAPDGTRELDQREYRDRLPPDRMARDPGVSRPTVDNPGFPENNRRYRDTSSSILDSPPTEFHPVRLMHGNGVLEVGRKPSQGVRGVAGTRSEMEDPSSRRYNTGGASNRHHLDPSSAFSSHGRQRIDGALRNDSLGSDPSDFGPRSKPHRHRNGGRRQSSMSSSDDGIQTTPEGTSAEEQDLESESISEKGRLRVGC